MSGSHFPTLHLIGDLKLLGSIQFSELRSSAIHTGMVIVFLVIVYSISP